MNTTRTARRSLRNRSLGIVAGIGIAAGLAATGAGLASAGTMPISHPGEPTVAMTITNHTNRTEYLAGANAGTGEWVNAPRRTLAPGATEIVTAAAPHSNHETVTINYRIGRVGPHAVYQLVNSPSGANTNATGVTGGNYWINADISTGFPNANVGYDLW